MVAANDPFLRVGRAGQPGDDVVERLDVPVEGQLEVHGGLPGSDVVGDGQRAAPGDGSDRSAESGQQRLRVAVRDREHGDPGNRPGVLDRQPLRVGRGAHARRERIAGIDGHVLHAAALHPVARPHRSFREHVAAEVPVVSRIGVNEASDGAVFGRHLRFDAPPRGSVARDHDGALHRDAKSVEILVVRRPAVVDVDEGSGDVAVRRVGVVGGQLLGLLAGGRVTRHRGLFQFRDEPRRRHHLEQAFLRRRKQDVETLDLRVPAPRLEPGEHPLGVVLVVRRADMVRPGAQALVVGPDVRRRRQRAERRLPPLAVLSRGLRCGLLGRHRHPPGGNKDQYGTRCSSHGGPSRASDALRLTPYALRPTPCAGLKPCAI